MRSLSRIAFVIALGVSLGGCYISHERAPEAVVIDPPSCSRPTVASCDAWEPDGEPHRVSAPAAPGEHLQLVSAVEVDCEVLVSWVVVTSERRVTTVRHLTRTLSRAGEPTSAIEPHPPLTRESPSWSGLRLAASESRVGGLMEADSGCVFVPLDPRGRELGAPVELAADASCRALEASGTGFSFVLSTIHGAAPITLVTMDEGGATRDRAELDVPPDRTWWSRARFEDGSFLSYSFAQDPMTSIYQGWFQRFDEAGAPLSEEVELGENGVPVHIAPTTDGALATWTTSTSGGQPVRLRPIDRDGRARGSTRDVPAEGALYGLVIRATPDGGALIAWEENHSDADPSWRLRAQSLTSEGAARGAPSDLVTGSHAEVWELLVDPSGRRALLLFSHNGEAVDAQSLRCAD